MKHTRMKRTVLACLLTLAMILGLGVQFLPTTASAATSGELKQQLNVLKDQKADLEAQMRELENQISENSSQIERMVAEKNVIDQEIFLLYEQITNINDQIATYSLLIADKQEELVAAQERYNDLLEKNRERIQSMEEQGDLSYWSVLFQANSFSDFLDRINMIREIAAADQRRLKELNAAAVAVEEAQAVLEEEKLGLEATKEELDAAQEVLEVKREEASALLTELVDQGIEYALLVEASEAANAELMQQIAKTEDAYDEAVYQEWLATSVPPTTKPKPPSTTEPTEPAEDKEDPKPTEKPEEEKPSEEKPAESNWIVPIRYTAFTSPFGYRDAPTAGASTFHQGVDLAAPEGRPIWASRSGKVIAATHNSSAGYYVQIDHGDGFKSIYMHMTRYTVKKGQYVNQGDVIGYCGSTGISTGPHLHFGISKNGTYVNPANYIPI